MHGTILPLRREAKDTVGERSSDDPWRKQSSTSKGGHRYPIVLGGASHVNCGEGYAIYANGKLLAESAAGEAVELMSSLTDKQHGLQPLMSARVTVGSFFSRPFSRDRTGSRSFFFSPKTTRVPATRRVRQRYVSEAAL